MKSKPSVTAALFSAASACALVVGLALVSPAQADEKSPNLSQSLANRLSLFHDSSISAFGTTKGDIPGSPGGGLIAPFLGRYVSHGDDGVGDGRDWAVSGTPIFGYDSNPEGLKNAKSSLFVGADVNAGYSLQLDPDDSQYSPTTFALAYDLAGALYEGQAQQADSIQQTISAGVRHGMFGDTVVLSGLIKDQFTLTQGQAFLHTFDFVPSAEFFLIPEICPYVSTEIAYDYAHLDYSYNVIRTQDPDAERNTMILNLHLYTQPQTRYGQPKESSDRLGDIMRQALGSAVIGFDHVWNFADGQSYKYESNRVRFALQDIHPLRTRDVSMDFQYSHEWQNYLHPSTETARTLGGLPRAIRRHDHVDIFTIRANARLADLAKNRGTLGAFVQWDLVNDRSVVPLRDFNEFIISTGLTYRY